MVVASTSTFWIKIALMLQQSPYLAVTGSHPKTGQGEPTNFSDLEYFYFFNYLFIYLFIHFWLRWVFIAARRLSLVAASRGYSSLRCAGFSLRWLLLLRSTGSRCTGFSSCGSRALEHRLSSHGAWAQLLRGMWDLPGPGLEPVSPALAGGFLTTAPPGKSLEYF